MMVFVPIVAAQTDIIFPWVSNNDNFTSKIIINNLDPTEATVVLVATRNDGSEQGKEVTIPGNGQLVTDAGQLFDTLGNGVGYRVIITSSNKVDAAQVVAGTTTASGSSPAQADSLNPADAAPILRFNYMPIGNGFSAPVVVNMGNSDATIKFHAYQNGALAASSGEVTLAAGRPFASVTSDLFPNMTGDFLVVAEADQPLLGSAFLFNDRREPSMANAKAMDKLLTAPASYNRVTVYRGYLATGQNYSFEGYVKDFGGNIGTIGGPTVGAYDPNGDQAIPLTTDMLVDPESVILAAGLTADLSNANVPIQDIPIVVGALGITMTRMAVPAIQEVGQTETGTALPNGPVTLAQWLKAEATLTIVCNNDGTSDATIVAKNLLPNRLYTSWQTIQGDDGIVVAPFAGVPNVVTTDEQGNAVFRRTLTYCPNNIKEGEQPLLLVDLLLHSDQMVYGGIPTTTPFSNDAHVHIEFDTSVLPE